MVERKNPVLIIEAGLRPDSIVIIDKPIQKEDLRKALASIGIDIEPERIVMEKPFRKLGVQIVPLLHEAEKVRLFIVKQRGGNKNV